MKLNQTTELCPLYLKKEKKNFFMINDKRDNIVARIRPTKSKQYYTR